MFRQQLREFHMFCIGLISVPLCFFLQAAGWRTWWAECECRKDWRCRANHTWRAVWTGTWCYGQSAKLVELCGNCNGDAHVDGFTGKDLKRPKLGDGDHFQPAWFRAGLFFWQSWISSHAHMFLDAWLVVPRYIVWCRKKWPWWWRRPASRGRSCWSRSWWFCSLFSSSWCSWHSQVHRQSGVAICLCLLLSVVCGETYVLYTSYTYFL